MNNKHTPGSWVYDKTLSAIVVIYNHTVKAVADFGKCSLPENEANAQLMAAAPELLDAVNKLVKLHADWDKGSAYVPVAFYEKNNAAIAEARAAIAKATK
jgi:hypothetical protein